MIKAEILLDSIGEDGSAPRLTTWLLTIPRCVLAELNTHRAASRNCPSSRAIPVTKRMKMVWNDLFSPIEWGLDRPGMQAGEKATGLRLWAAKATWKVASVVAIAAAWVMVKLGIHKQVANRILEPFVWVTDLVTMDQFGLENFLALRAERSADPHMQALAYQMIMELNRSIPQVLKPGEWHIPYGDRMYPGLTWEQKIKVAVARCARVSFNSFDGKNDPEKDYGLHDTLAKQGHWSSFEHIARVPDPTQFLSGAWFRENLQAMQGNLRGWLQLRKTYPNECRRDQRIASIMPGAELRELGLAGDAIRKGMKAMGYTRILILYHASTLGFHGGAVPYLDVVAQSPTTGERFSYVASWHPHNAREALTTIPADVLAHMQGFVTWEKPQEAEVHA